MELIRRLISVQAQELDSATMSLCFRSSHLTVADVHLALQHERSVVRTWLWRGTLQLAPADELRWMLPLAAAGPLRQSVRRLQQLGLDQHGYETARAAAERHLANGPATRNELKPALATTGVDISGQAPYRILRRAALEGVVCLGPRRASDDTYVLCADWLPPQRAPPPAAAMQELARRYRASHGPTDPADMAHWSGLPRGRVAEAWAGGTPTINDTERSPRSRLLALPACDPLVLHYSSRRWLADEAAERVIHPGGGLFRPSLVADGRIVGSWRFDHASSTPSVQLLELGAPAREGSQHVAEDLSRIVGVPVRLHDA